MKTANRNISLIIMPCLFTFIISSFCFAEESSLVSYDPNTYIPAIIESLSQVQTEMSGAGKAQVIQTDYYDNSVSRVENSTVTFKFKGQKSRSFIDTTESDGKKTDIRWFVNEDHTGLYSNKSVILRKDKFGYYEEQVGKDFNPETFTRVSFQPLSKILNKLLDADEIKCQMDMDGKLFIKATYNRENKTYSFHEIVLDSKGDLKLNSWSCTVKLPDKTAFWKASYVWDTDSKWQFIKEAHIEDGILNTDNMKTSKVVRDVKITAFSPMVDVSDEDFTLAGLDIPDGTMVSDATTGISYIMGSQP